MNHIKVSNLSFSYAGDEKLILKDINMDVDTGE